MKFRFLALALFSLLAFELPAQAQGTQVRPTCADRAWSTNDLGRPFILAPDGTLCVNASVSASISGFAPAATGTPISVTTSDSTGTLPAGTVVSVFNVGTTNVAYCKLGATSTTSDIPIQPGSWFAYTVGAATQLTCKTSTSTTTVNMIGGSGLPTGAGGGGSGGGGGAVTIASGAVASGGYSSGAFASGSFASGSMAAGSHAAGAGVDGWDLTQGAIADAAATQGSTGSVSAKLRTVTSQLNTGNTSLASIAANTTGATQVSTTASSSTVAPIGVSNYADKVVISMGDPCQTGVKVPTSDASQTASTRYVTATAAKKTYICEIFIFANAAEVVSVVEGTGSTCGTGTKALYGNATVANGISLSANGGFARGNGGSMVQASPTANTDICILQSGSSRINISLVTVQQ